MFKFGKNPPRALKSFGVAGVMEPEAHVFYDALFSSTHIGRISDLLAAKLQDSGADELRLRALLLVGFFEAFKGQLSSPMDKAVTEPLVVECGVDSEKVAVGVSFRILSEKPQFEGMIERVISGKAEGYFEDLLHQFYINADGVVLKIQQSGNHLEIIGLLGIKNKIADEFLAKKIIESVEIPTQTETSPQVEKYVELGDLDYPNLLREKIFGIEDKHASDGEVLTGLAEEAVKISLKKNRDRASVVTDVSAAGEESSQIIHTRSAAEAAEISVKGDSFTQPMGEDEVVKGIIDEEDDDEILVKGKKEPLVDDEKIKVKGHAEKSSAEKISIRGQSPEDRQESFRIKGTTDIIKDEVFVVKGTKSDQKLEDDTEIYVQDRAQDTQKYEDQIKELQDRLALLEMEKKELEDTVSQAALAAEEEDADPQVEAPTALETVSERFSGILGSSFIQKIWSPFKRKKAEDGVDENLMDAESNDSAEGSVSSDGSETVVSQGDESKTDSPSDLDSKAKKSVEGVPEKAAPEGELDFTPREELKKEQIVVPVDTQAQAKNLVTEFQTSGRFTQTVMKAQKEAVSLKKELNPQVKRWVERLVQELTFEKSRLYEITQKLNESVRQKEGEFLRKERVYKAEIRKKEDQLKQKAVLLNKTKEQLDDKNQMLGQLKENAQGNASDAIYRQKYEHLQKMLNLSKTENSNLSRKLSELKSALATARYTASQNSSGPTETEFKTLKARYELFQRQVDELKQENENLMGRLSRADTSKRSEMKVEELKNQLDQANRQIISRQKEVENLRAQMIELRQSEVQLKQALEKAKRELNAAKSGAKGKAA